MVAFLVALLSGYVLLALASIALGLLRRPRSCSPTTASSASTSGFPHWLAGERTETWTDVSWVGSELAGGYVIPAVIALVALVMVDQAAVADRGLRALRRRRRVGDVPRDDAVRRAERPDVERLESLPVDASYPSGHTAASIALYSGLALLLTSRFARGGWRIAIWVVALAIPPVVALSRIYRGMHHPIDALAGVPIGIAALVVVVFACRVAGAAIARREARAEASMKHVAVVAHAGKTIGGGLLELRRVLEAAGVADPLWYEVPKSRKAPKQVKRALEEGAELVFAWGGDGTVQRCIDVLAGTGTPLAIVPAGTANLLATNLGIPSDIEEAVRIGLNGARRSIDVGRMNGERFGVMAGAGFDAAMIRDADAGLKDRFGRIAYVWTGARNVRAKPFKAKIRVDGATWFDDKASCILVGNVGNLFGGIEAFDDAKPDDGMLELGVVTADGLVQWARTIARTAVGTSAKSPFVQVTRARTIEVELDRKVLYELDGGDREKVKSFEIEIEPGAIEICVPVGR